MRVKPSGMFTDLPNYSFEVGPEADSAVKGPIQ